MWDFTTPRERDEGHRAAWLASVGQEPEGRPGRGSQTNMSKLKPFLMTFAVVAVSIAIINRVEALRKLVYGA